MNEKTSRGMFESESCSVVSDSLRSHRLYSPWNSPGQNTGVGSLSLLQGIFPTLGSNPGPLHCRQILYQLSHKGSPRILEWVAYPFSNGYSWSRNGTKVSCIAGRFFTNWAIREALICDMCHVYICAMAYYSAIKKNDILAFAVTWMDLVGTMLSKMSDREKQNIIQLHVYV